MNSTTIQLERMDRILEISHELVGTRTLDEILHQIVDVATELLDCETTGILLLDDQPNNLRFVAVALYQDQLFNIPVPIDASIAGAAFMSDKPVIVLDTQSDPRYYPKVAEALNYPAHSLLSVPLTFRSHKIGVLEAENKKNGQQFNEQDAQVLTALAIQATIAIENARQLERYKQLAQAEKIQRQMSDALRLASVALASTLDYDQVIDRILEQVGQVIPNNTCNVMMLNGEDEARVFRGLGYAYSSTADTFTSTMLSYSNAPVLRRIIETRQPTVIADVMQDPTWVYSRPEHRWIRSYVGAPIIVRDAVVGFLNVNSATPNLYSQTHAEHLQAFAHHAAIAIENARLYRQSQEEIARRIKIEEELRRHRDHLEELVKERTAELHHLAITDPLTETFNRRHFFMLGNQVVGLALRYHHPLSAMMIDIDHFKEINDRFGHAVGDLVLKNLVQYLQHNLRSTDILGRYGGEEFVVLAAESDLENSRQTAERLLAGIRALRIPTNLGDCVVSASIGIATLHDENNDTLDTLLQRADQAMYAAKRAGRNCVCMDT